MLFILMDRYGAKIFQSDFECVHFWVPKLRPDLQRVGGQPEIPGPFKVCQVGFTKTGAPKSLARFEELGYVFIKAAMRQR